MPVTRSSLHGSTWDWLYLCWSLACESIINYKCFDVSSKVMILLLYCLKAIHTKVVPGFDDFGLSIMVKVVFI